VIRDSLGDKQYWEDRVRKAEDWMAESSLILQRPSKNDLYRPQFSFDCSMDVLRLILTRYSAGRSVAESGIYFSSILENWELSNRLAAEVCSEKNLVSCRNWVFTISNLNHYNWCFWLVGLALALDIPKDEWDRLIALIGGEGEDMLLDRIIGVRQPGRKVGLDLLHKKPYSRLLKVIDSPPENQPELLKEFVLNWYPELARKGKAALWWYVFGDEVLHPLTMGSYFGRWCLEAVAAVKAFDLDDGLCLGLEHYPAALIHQDIDEKREPKVGWGRTLWNKFIKH